MRRLLSVLVVAGVLGVPHLAVVEPVAADGPGNGTPWLVSLGDSYISGEAGRWAGNSNTNSSLVDAGGSAAYFDNGGTSETTAGCHRGSVAPVHIGVSGNGTPVNTLNLACSGSKVATSFAADGSFKPGVDFYSSGSRAGQALQLQRFAATHNVRMVLLSIGGNNFNFATIVQRCVANFLTSSSLFPNYCYDDSVVSSNFTKANVAAQTAAIKGAIDNVKRAMANAGYTSAGYTIVVQTYPSPLPGGSGFRYPQSGFSRQSTGGCGFWNRDADWANSTALAGINGAVKAAASSANTSGNVKVLDVSSSLNGRRLCETGVKLFEQTGLGSWSASGAVDVSEWVAQIRTVSTIGTSYQVQESLHPNWWAQQALQNCVRQAWNDGSPTGGVCTRSASGLTAIGEPIMRLA